MARREIKRQVEEIEPASVTGQVEEQEEVFLPVEKQARLAEVKPVDVTVTVRKRPAIMAIRMLRNMVLFNDGYKTMREKLDPTKPVTVRISQ